MLEDRLTPAGLTFYWKGTDTDFAKATNWFGAAQGTPGVQDNIIFGVGAPNPIAVGEGDPPPAPLAPSVMNCVIATKDLSKNYSVFLRLGRMV